MLTHADSKDEAIDWRLTTWEGAQREQMRRWAELPLESIIRALEEMEQLSEQFSAVPQRYALP